MKDITIKTIGWTLFGISFVIMFWGSLISLSLSNMDSEIRTTHTINMDNQTKEALIKLSDMPYNTKCIVKEYDYAYVYEELDSEWDSYKRRILVNEYITNNCSISNK